MLKITSNTTIKNCQVSKYEFTSKNARALAKEVQDLKRRLDIVLNRNVWSTAPIASVDLTWATERGFDLQTKPPSGTGIEPMVFVRLLLGSVCRHMNTPEELATVPSNALIGWNRRRHMAKTREEADEKREFLDQKTLSNEDGHAHAVKQFGLVICGEGKHRYELYADFFDDMLVNLSQMEYPEAHQLKLSKVRGDPHMLHLACKQANGTVEKCLLPFGYLSEKLLAQIGVQVSGTWSAMPWSDEITKLVGSSASRATKLSFKPAKIRGEILAASYV